MGKKRILRKKDEELDKKFYFLSNRNDDIYTDIDNLQQHEYTTCIIYEMFIRVNEDNKREYYFEDDIAHIEPQKISDIVLFIKNGIFTLQDIIYELFPQLENDIKKFLSNHYKIPIENYNEINKVFLDYSINLNYLMVNYIDRYKNQQEDELNKVIFKEVEYFDKAENITKKIDFDKLESIIVDNNNVTTVIPYYKRPQIFLKENQLVNINYLNLALPDEELFDFIKQLKVKVKKESNLLNKYIKSTKYSNHYFNDEKIETKINHKYNIFKYKHSSKMADVFFIYDAFKINKYEDNDNLESYNDLIHYIQKEIYYSKDTPPAKYISESTINTYHKTAEYYIDEKQYISLLKNLN